MVILTFWIFKIYYPLKKKWFGDKSSSITGKTSSVAFIGVSSRSTKLDAAFTTNQIPSLGRRRVLLYEDSDEPFF